MNKKAIYSISFSLILPVNVYALGLGDLKVNSYLNQPLDAEIRLVDVGRIPLSGINVDLASVEEFEKVGIEQPYVLSQLKFKVTRNKKGRPIVKITSSERMTEPYLEFLLDLTWSSGQLYRTYTILLDPPGYQLELKQKKYKSRRVKQSYQKGVVDKDIASTVVRTPITVDTDAAVIASYGPVKANEDIWEIAQRYKPSNVSLQQVILGIVGMNPQAFKDGNLNGLKKGARLKIPNYNLMVKIPDAKAKLEVIEHDKAWRDRSTIEHILKPPYYENNEAVQTPKKDIKEKPAALKAKPVIADDKVAIQQQKSDIKDEKTITVQKSQAIPQAIPQVKQKPATKAQIKKSEKPESLLNGISSWPNIFDVEEEKPQVLESNIAKLNAAKASEKTKTLNADFAVAVSTIKSIKDSNKKLKQQLEKLKQQNTSLQDILNKRDNELKNLNQVLQQTKKELVTVKNRSSVAGQTSSGSANTDSSGYYALLSVLAFLILAGGGLGFMYLRRRGDEAEFIELQEDNVQAAQTEQTPIPPVTVKKAPEADDSSSGDITTLASVLSKAESALEQDEQAEGEQIKQPQAKEVSQQTSAIDSASQGALDELEQAIAGDETKPEDEKVDVIAKTVKAKPPKRAKKDTKKSKLKEKAKPSEPKSEELTTEKAAGDLSLEVDDKQEAAKQQSSVDEHKLGSADGESLELEEQKEAPSEKLSLEPEEQKEEPKQGLSLEPDEKKEEAKQEFSLELDDEKEDVKQAEQESIQELTLDIEIEDDEKAAQDPETNEQAEAIEYKRPLSGLAGIASEMNIQPDLSSEQVKGKKETKDSAEQELNLDSLELSLEEDSPTIQDADEKSTEPQAQERAQEVKPIKSNKALDTLLALAKTYISMEDWESARQSLQEVAEFGSDKQKREANQLLNSIEDK